MKDASVLIDALAGLAWPLFATVVLWRLLPEIKNIVRNRAFTIRVGENELTVQQFSEQIVESTADIQEKLTAVGGGPDRREASPPAAVERSSDLLRRVLWVDDNPANNAYEAAQLQTLGVDVVQVRSTKEGLRALDGARPPFDAVITDLNRSEDSGYKPDAGLELIREIRAKGDTTPTFVYASHKGLARKEEITALGGSGVASSPTALFNLLREAGRFPGATT